MKNVNFVFLILNYNNYSDTVECIVSIKKLNFMSYDIVVVDNGSTDDSLILLSKKYSNEDIHIVNLPKNVGFSAGNNYGYKYIKAHFQCEFIIISNNDIIFEQKEFLAKIYNLYNRTDFYLCGPDIIVKDSREHQSPICYKLPTPEELQKEIQMYEYYAANPQKWVKRRKWQVRKNLICQRFKLIDYLYARKKHKDQINYNKFSEDCCLQGACLIVSKNFINLEEKIFYPETFLYCEELLLFKRCLDQKYKIVYSPEIYVIHNDSSTMKKVTANAYDKAVFTLNYHVESRKILLDVIMGKVNEQD